MDERLQRLRSLFDGVADRYDAVRPGYPRVVVDDLLDLVGLTSGSRVLEIGCGTGHLTVEAVPSGAGGGATVLSVMIVASGPWWSPAQP